MCYVSIFVYIHHRGYDITVNVASFVFSHISLVLTGSLRCIVYIFTDQRGFKMTKRCIYTDQRGIDTSVKCSRCLVYIQFLVCSNILKEASFDQLPDRRTVIFS